MILLLSIMALMSTPITSLLSTKISHFTYSPHFVRGVRSRCFASVTGTVYGVDDDKDAPTITLFTKEGCTLCDKVKDVLKDIRKDHPHSLEAIDITDPDQTEYWAKYKFDIPVLHMEQMYWAKHRLTTEEAIQGISTYKDGSFEPPKGEPNAAKYERGSQ